MEKTPIPMDNHIAKQATGLKRLAWGLLGDEHSAEDVLQDAWLSAWNCTRRSGEKEQVSEGWFRKAVRHLAYNRYRSQRARHHHERQAAQPEVDPSLDLGAYQREWIDHLIDSLAALGEPYKTVLVMRYYQDMAPRKIAQELGIPTATVKSQLTRGLEKLRTRLDAKADGKRRAWLAALSSSATRPTLPVSWIGWLCLGLAGMWGMSAAVQHFEAQPLGTLSSDTPSAAPAAPIGTASNKVAPNITGAKDPKPMIRQALLPTAPGAQEFQVPPSAPSSENFDLHLEVFTLEELPLYNAEVLLAPVAHPLNLVGKTNSQGKLSLRWSGKSGTQEYAISIRSRGKTIGPLRRIKLSSGEALNLRISTAEYALSRDQPTTSTAPSNPGSTSTTPLARRFLPGSVSGSGDTGTIAFQWQAREAPDSMGVTEGPSRHQKLQRARQSPSHHSLHFLEQKMFSISGTVFRPNGLPADGAPLIYWRSGESWSGTLCSEGEFSYGWSPHETTWVRAGGGQFGIAEITLDKDLAEATDEIKWRPTLNRGLEISGSVLVENHLSTEEWLVRVDLHDTNSTHSELYHFPEGRISMPNMPAGRGEIHLMTSQSWPFSLLSQNVISPSTANELWIHPNALRATPVEILVLDPHGTPHPSDVRLWQASTGHGVSLEFSSETGAHHCAGIPKGVYSLCVGTSEHGYQVLGPFQAELEGALSIGPILLPAPGTIQLDMDSYVALLGAEPRLVLRKRSGIAVSYIPVPLESGKGDITVPAGDYQLSIQTPGLAKDSLQFNVQPGSSTNLSWTDSEGLQVTRGRD